MIKYGDKVRVIKGFYEGVEGKAMAYHSEIGVYLITISKDGNNIEVAQDSVVKTII